MEEDSKLFAFVLMPFDSSFDDVYRFGIKEPAKELGILAQRVDEQIYREGILERIYRQIESADIVIADMTGRNANVFYEVGYAHAKNKVCILLTSDADDIPFDLKHRRHVVYGGSIKTLSESVAEELKWAKGEVQNIRGSHINVSLEETYGVLKKTDYSDFGEISMKIDLLNDSEEPSPELEALYFYSTAGWAVYQDGTECPSTASDLGDFKKRHFLTLPVRRLQKGAWAQIKIVTKKTLARKFLGDIRKDSYQVAGRTILRLVTSKGNFDYQLSINVEVSEDIPF
jgi:hypothetical protein